MGSKLAGVYKIENIVTGQCYIGQSIDVLTRWRQHIRDAWGPKPHSLIAKAIKKHGIERFSWQIIQYYDREILSRAYLTRLLKDAEEEYIEKFDSFKNGYNRDMGERKPVYYRPKK